MANFCELSILKSPLNDIYLADTDQISADKQRVQEEEENMECCNLRPNFYNIM